MGGRSAPAQSSPSGDLPTARISYPPFRDDIIATRADLGSRRAKPALAYTTSSRSLPSDHSYGQFSLSLKSPESYRSTFPSIRRPLKMPSDENNALAESGVTIPSDSEQYDQDMSASPPSSSSPVVLYKPPTAWSLIRGAAINLLLPFINGMMLGFGELFAHEAAFRLGWGGTKVCQHWSNGGSPSHAGIISVCIA